MAEVKLTEDEVKRGIDLMGWSEEQAKSFVPNLTPYQKRFMKHVPDFFNYKIIQEVVWAKNCARNPKPGDKTVFAAVGMFLPEESTFPGCGFCTFAITQILPFLYVVYDRICSGLDPSPMGINYIKCPDIEPAEGGTGSVLFKVYCIKSPIKVKKDIYRDKFKA